MFFIHLEVSGDNETMSEEENVLKQKQQKLLGKLNWLIDRTKPDFKGNLPPFVRAKTKHTVEKSKKVAERSLQGGLFLPYGQRPVPLAMDAVRVVQTSSSPQANDQLDASTCNLSNAYHQILDKQTGRPEIYEVLQFSGRSEAEKVRGKKRFAESIHTECSATSSRPSAKDVDTATPQQKLLLLRAEALNHPKFTETSRFQHSGSHWDAMSQLPPNAQLSPPRKQKAPLMQSRNEIRMVRVMRSHSCSAAWK